MDKRTGKVLAVIGGQLGSEGKGNNVHHIANQYQIHVRVGGPNAGHSFIYKGVTYKMQSIPCGWTNPDASLVIGRGALVDLHQLQTELAIVEKVDPTIWDRLHVDARAGIIEDRHRAGEGGTAGELHRRIGSTGEGVGAARRDRMSRNPYLFHVFSDLGTQAGRRDLGMDEAVAQRLLRLKLPDTAKFLHDAVRLGDNVLLEGTQGSGLSLIHGPWPYVTSADTNAAQLAADVGLPPGFIDDVLLVIRTFPIRVAGNSGPLKGEFGWEELSERLGYTVEERTTVTKKTRRIGIWDPDLVERSIRLNDPSALAVNFLDYLDPADAGATHFTELSDRSQGFVQYLESYFQLPVTMLGTGGPNWTIIDC